MGKLVAVGIMEDCLLDEESGTKTVITACDSQCSIFPAYPADSPPFILEVVT